MKRLILLLFILLAIAILANSQVPIHASGADGMALLKNLTESSHSSVGSDDTTNSSVTNSTNNSTSNLTNSSTNKPINNAAQSVKNKKADDLWSWGSKPKSPPTNPSQYDYLNDTGMDV